MDEQEIFFGKGPVRLEGRYAPSGNTLGAVVSHPHPLMGGEMDNPVVGILAEALSARGISTLRFNFRGVGGSSGRYDEGRGEQDDLLAALAFLEEQGVREVLPVGYSFGAWVTAGVLSRRNVLPAILVAPPIDIFPFEYEALRGKVGLIVCGDRDQFCPSERIRVVADELSCRLEVIPGADHFFLSREQDLAASVVSFAMRLRPQPEEEKGGGTQDGIRR